MCVSVVRNIYICVLGGNIYICMCTCVCVCVCVGKNIYVSVC